MAAACTAAWRSGWRGRWRGVSAPVGRCCKGELHITTEAITAAIPVLTRVTGDEETAFVLLRGTAPEALRLVR
jgi:hypothetical protein